MKQRTLMGFQGKLLLSSKIKLSISLLSAVLIPVFFRSTSLYQAEYTIDRFIAVPVIVVFAEIFALEQTNHIVETIYITKMRKNALYLARFLIATGLMMGAAVLGLLEAVLLDPNMIRGEGGSIGALLPALYAWFSTIFFFGAFAMTMTALTGKYAVGAAVPILFYVVLYFVDYFLTNRITSLFIYRSQPIWPWSKLFYLGIGFVLFALCILKAGDFLRCERA
ncbi:MAG: hypothetical protein II889_01325 [Clostridia bacterium]|nr:hypothetical protein [Clostridia bacterium]